MDRQAIIQQQVDQEQVSTPDRISSQPELRRGGTPIRRAYCKTDAGSGSTIQAYLDTDATGEEITVHCDIVGDETDLSNCVPPLADGNPLPVYKDKDTWRCLWWFVGDLDCENS